MEILGIILVVGCAMAVGFWIGYTEAAKDAIKFLNFGNKITKGQKKEEEKCQEAE